MYSCTAAFLALIRVFADFMPATALGAVLFRPSLAVVAAILLLPHNRAVTIRMAALLFLGIHQ
jgi:hypothetical protein